VEPLARSKFSINDRVMLSEQGKSQFHRELTGTVVGFGRQPTTVRILVDGKTTISNYHHIYWQRIPLRVPPSYQQ
jgi:hypothetical protein